MRTLERTQLDSRAGRAPGGQPPLQPAPSQLHTVLLRSAVTTLEPRGKERERKKNCLLGPGPASQPPSPPARSSQGKQLLTSPCVLPARSQLPGGRGRGARPGGGAERAGRPAFLSPRSSSPPPLAPASSLLPHFGAWLGFLPAREVSSLYPQCSYHLTPSQRGSRSLLLSPPCPRPRLPHHPALPSAALSPGSQLSILAGARPPAVTSPG